MIRQWNGFLVSVAAIAVLVLASCGSATTSPGASQPVNPTPGSAQPAAGSQPLKINLDEIFPSGKGRELLLNNCTSCHTFVPIVVLQMPKESWVRNASDHRDRVTAMNDTDYKILYDYIVENFNPDKPVPKLPKDLLDTWTSY